VEIQLIWKKYQTISKKSQTWWLLHKRYLEHDQAGLASDGWAANFFVFNKYNFFRKVGTRDFRQNYEKVPA
jgi:hypothetical protein